MTSRIDQYWHNFFNLPPDSLSQECNFVVPHARPWHDHFVYLFVHDKTGVVSAGPDQVSVLRQRVADLPAQELLTPTAIRTLFDQPPDRLIGPLFQGWAEVDDFRPCPSPHVRRLQPADRPNLRRLADACDPTEWSYSGITTSKVDLFGYFRHEELVTVAHYDIRGEFGASIGIITHPGHRGRGYAKAAVSAAMQHAFDGGQMVLYQTHLANAASVALSSRLGCRPYAQSLGVYLKTHD